MNKILLHITLYISVLLLASCATTKTDVLAVCELNSVNNYEIKWEVFPPVDGYLQVYQFSSGDLTRKDLRRPDQVVSISSGQLEVVDNNGQRAFFFLNFNNEYQEVISNRFIKIPGIEAIRDIGGYRTKDGNQIAWGKLLRGPEFQNLYPISKQQLAQLNTNLLISLDHNRYDYLADKQMFKSYRFIPIYLKGFDQINERILNNECKRGDVALYIEDMYTYLLKRRTEEYASVLRLMSDKDNYPIMISSHHQEEKIDFLIAMLLDYLGVNTEDIVDDYLTSNQGLDLRNYFNVVGRLSSDSQEALTYLLTANKRSVDFLLQKVRKDYGSVESYFKKELHLTDKELSDLRKNLILNL
ncbi:MAG: tyrosine-protein phosphatase [Bacteroidales bacterium]